MTMALKSSLLAGAVFAGLALAASAASAQDAGVAVSEVKGVIGAALTYRPTYDGNDEREANFRPVIDLTYRDQAFVKYDVMLPYRHDNGIGYNFIKTPNLRAAVLGNYFFNREEDDDRSRLAGTGDVGNSVELGALVEYQFDYFKFDYGARIDVADSHNGIIMEGGVSVGAALSPNFTLVGRLGTKWGSQNYMQKQWGITTNQAGTRDANGCGAVAVGSGGAAGLNTASCRHYSSGMENVNLSLTGDYRFEGGFGLRTTAALVRYIEDVEKSYYVDAPDGMNYMLGAAVTYNF